VIVGGFFFQGGQAAKILEVDRRPWDDRSRIAPTAENVDLVGDLV